MKRRHFHFTIALTVFLIKTPPNHGGGGGGGSMKRMMQAFFSGRTLGQ